MKNKNLQCTTILTVIAVCGLSSCIPGSYPPDPYYVSDQRQKENTYYATMVPNVPLLSDHHDLSFATQFQFESRYKGADIQAAYVPVRHLGIMADVHFYRQKAEENIGKLEGYEFGAGYLNSWSRLHAEVYAGIGGGGIRNEHHTGMSRLRYSSIFIQPTLAYQNKKKTLQLAFVSKLTHTKFAVSDTTLQGEREGFVLSQLQGLHRTPNHLFWEPGLVFRTGWKSFLFQASVSVSKNLSANDFHHDRTQFSLGLIFRANTSKPL